MDMLLGWLNTAGNLALVVVGFSTIIFVHELGHFLAARWAGIRVLAFAIGFGPAAVSYRPGMGWQRGSSEGRYRAVMDSASGDAAGGDVAGGGRRVSPTEYRINWLPLGGYVKMLGQEDLNPGAVSDARDSYQSCVPWKRMVVISAGVVMNIIFAALLFVVVYMVGLRVQPAVVGEVTAGMPAASAVALEVESGGAAERGVTEAGLRPGDRVVEVNGHRPTRFDDLVMEVALSEAGKPVRLVVERAGVEGRLTFEATPRKDEASKLLLLGISPPQSSRLLSAGRGGVTAELRAFLDSAGLVGVEPGARLASVAGEVIEAEAVDAQVRLSRAFEASGGGPVSLTWENPGGGVVTTEIRPRGVRQVGYRTVGVPADGVMAVGHVLGLEPVRRLGSVGGPLPAGLREGDVLVRVGESWYPSLAEAMRTIRSMARREVKVAVLRDGAMVEVVAPVNRRGQIGVVLEEASELAVVARPLALRATREGPAGLPVAAGLIETPGTRIVEIDGESVGTFEEIRTALVRATAARVGTGAEAIEVPVVLELPRTAAEAAAGVGPTVVRRAWSIPRAEAEAVAGLGWEVPGEVSGLFDVFEQPLRASNPVEAVSVGLAETRRVMVKTYVTFLRLGQGSADVRLVQGPVGIAASGTVIAERGAMWLLFFMALISVNLAVVNFLPLPIVDGGQFLMILYEQIRGKPVPMGVQNAATMVGLVMIGALFLFATYNDISRLLGG